MSDKDKGKQEKPDTTRVDNKKGNARKWDQDLKPHPKSSGV